MWIGSYNHRKHGHSALPLDGNRRYAWKERTYAVPSPTRKRFQWKASALLGLQRLNKTQVAGHPATVVVPALYSLMPAEALAHGWLNEIDTLGRIRQKIIMASKLTGWDVFTFHTHHNLDSYFDTTIAAVRETWLREGSLKTQTLDATVRQFGPAYEYHRMQGRLVENLVFQSSLIEWLSARAEDVPLQFQFVGTALLSALVWSRAISFDAAVRVASHIGEDWDASICAMAAEDLERSKTAASDENLGWRRFHRVRQLLEGRTPLSLQASLPALPALEAPVFPFLYSPTAQDEPIAIETAEDVRRALKTLNLSSWAPALPKPIAGIPVRGWLISGLHPMAQTCRWSFYNYLLATPGASVLFLDHIAALGRLPLPGKEVQENPQVYQNRFRLSRIKVTGP